MKHIILDSATKELRVSLDESTTSGPVTCTTHYYDSQAADIAESASEVLLNTAAQQVTIVSASGVQTARVITEISFHNGDTIAHNITMGIFDGTDLWIIWEKPLAPGKTIFLSDPPPSVTNVTTGGGTGNYDTLLDDAIASPEDVGGYPSGTLVSQVKGLSFIEIIDQLLFPSIPAVYTPPTSSLIGSNPKLLSVGASTDASLNASFTQNNAGAQTGYQLYKDGSPLSVNEAHTDLGVTRATPGNVTYYGEYTYADGPILNDNLGNPSPIGQILSGAVSSSNVVYQWIYPWFWGITSDPVLGNVDVGADGTEVVSIINGTISINFNSTSGDRLWFAVPAGEPAFIGWFDNATNFGSIGSPSDLFDAPTIVAVTTVNFAGVDYDLYFSNYGTEFTTPIDLNQ